MKKSTLVFVILLAGFSAFAQNTKAYLNDYFDAKTALVNSDTKSASTAINNFYSVVKSDGKSAQTEDLLLSVEKLKKAGNNLEKQRTAFNDVSIKLWKVIKETDTTGQSVYYQYCPMKKAYWLSKEKEIRNPYYGSSMLTAVK